MNRSRSPVERLAFRYQLLRFCVVDSTRIRKLAGDLLVAVELCQIRFVAHKHEQLFLSFLAALGSREDANPGCGLLELAIVTVLVFGVSEFVGGADYIPEDFVW